MPRTDQKGGTENRRSAERRRARPSKTYVHCSYMAAALQGRGAKPTGGPIVAYGHWLPSTPVARLQNIQNKAKASWVGSVLP